MRTVFTDAVAGALGVPGHLWDGGPEVGKDPLLAETGLAPWDIQVKAQGVRLAGKLRQAPAPSADRSLNGELGKALACAKRNGAERVKQNALLGGSLAPAAEWRSPLVRPRQGVGKRRWKANLQKGMKAATERATATTLRARPESVEEGGRQASTIHVGMSAVTGTRGKEAELRRRQIPSRSLRAQLRNLALGCVPYTRGALSRRAEGWDGLGPEMQRRVLKCPCNDPNQEGEKDDKPRDAVHMLLECNETKLVRHRVREAMDAVVARPGGPTEPASALSNRHSPTR